MSASMKSVKSVSRRANRYARRSLWFPLLTGLVYGACPVPLTVAGPMDGAGNVSHNGEISHDGKTSHSGNISYEGVIVAAETVDSDVRGHAAAMARAVAEQTSVQPSPEERARHALIEPFLTGADSGAWARLAGRRALPLTLQEASHAALKHNLALSGARIEPEKAAAALQEAKALFTPSLDLSVDYSMSDTRLRSRIGLVGLKKFFGGNNPNYDVDQFGRFSDELKAIVFRHFDAEAPRPDEVKASSDDKKGPPRQMRYTVTLQQQLPWGPSLTLMTQTRDKKVNYANDRYYDNGHWSSDVTLALSGPAPFAAGFGELATAEAAITRSRLQQTRTDLQLKETVNQILSQVDSAYWSLVEALEGLFAAEENLKLVSELASSVDRRFALERATVYDKALSDAEEAKARLQVEDARANYVAASSRLIEYISDDPALITESVALPYGYQALLAATRWLRTTEEEALRLATANRPRLLAEQAAQRIDWLDRDVAENRTRPDVQFNTRAVSQQNGSTYGYKGPFDLARVARPDTLRLAGGLRYSRPWGNVPAEAAATTATMKVNDRTLALEEVRADMERGIGDALSALWPAPVPGSR